MHRNRYIGRYEQTFEEKLYDFAKAALISLPLIIAPQHSSPRADIVATVSELNERCAKVVEAVGVEHDIDSVGWGFRTVKSAVPKGDTCECHSGPSHTTCSVRGAEEHANYGGIAASVYTRKTGPNSISVHRGQRDLTATAVSLEQVVIDDEVVDLVRDVVHGQMDEMLLKTERGRYHRPWERRVVGAMQHFREVCSVVKLAPGEEFGPEVYHDSLNGSGYEVVYVEAVNEGEHGERLKDKCQCAIAPDRVACSLTTESPKGVDTVYFSYPSEASDDETVSVYVGSVLVEPSIARGEQLGLELKQFVDDWRDSLIHTQK